MLGGKRVGVGLILGRGGQCEGAGDAMRCDARFDLYIGKTENVLEIN